MAHVFNVTKNQTKIDFHAINGIFYDREIRKDICFARKETVIAYLEQIYV